MTDAQDLWSPRDAACLRACQSALADQRLSDALLAVELADDDRGAWVERHLDDWAQQVRDACEAETPHAWAAALTHVLVDRVGLRGDSETYYRVENSWLSHVMRERRGMPILLAAVWILVARRAEIPVVGVGMPSHFIIRVGGEDGLYLDVFHDGEVLDTAKCQVILEKITGREVIWRDDFLTTVDDRGLLCRVLRNLANSHRRNVDHVGLYRSIRLLAHLLPDDSTVRLSLGKVAEHVGARQHAVTIYQDVITCFPNTPHADAARDAQNRLQRTTQLLN